MEVIELNGQKVEFGPGVHGFEAEAKVNCPDGKTVFVHGECYGDAFNLTVTEESIYGTFADGGSLDDIDCLEMYNGIGDTTGSKYYKVFTVLDQMLQLMEGD